MELICPSCEARYEVPEDSISARGRQVSCMNCNHSWHAYPPLQLGDGAGGGQQNAGGATASAAGGIPYDPPAGQRRPDEPHVAPDARSEMGADESGFPATPDDPWTAPPPDPNRPEQMAEIREMLASVQSEERAQQTDGGDNERTVVMPGAGQPRYSPAEAEAERARQRLEQEREAAMLEERARRAAEETDSDFDLRRKIDAHKSRSKSERSDVKKLRRRHERRVARQDRQSKAGSGAFLTGFLLVTIIASTMAALYLLAPQIVARMPEAERPMTEYVQTMDELRIGAAEGLENLKRLMAEKLGDREEG